MSNSPLVTYTKISPHKNHPRNHAIDTITIHCMAGDLTVETCGALFQRKEASSNYGIDSKGNVGMYVEEGDRSWATGSRENDHRAITIEVANTGGADQGWPVSPVAYAKLIDLIADICKRNNIKKLLWKNDKSLIGKVDQQNMTIHRWFANKACPGAYLYNRHGEIADSVNEILSAGSVSPEPEKPSSSTEAFVPYTIRITTKAINVRKTPGTNAAIVQRLVNDENVYTIVAEANAVGASKWGKLKSGLGWIALDYTKKV